MTDPDTFLDRMRIREVAELYFFHCDAKEPEGVVKCFARDGVLRSTTQADWKLQGHAALLEGFRGFAAYGSSCHSVASMDVQINGQTATSRLFATCHLAGKAEVGGPIFVRGLRYEDRWIVEDGRWVICERIHQALWQFENTLIPTVL